MKLSLNVFEVRERLFGSSMKIETHVISEMPIAPS